MEYIGHVKNGVVILADSTGLTDGTPVRVQPLPARRPKAKPRTKQSLGQRLMKFAGTAKGLPSDMARNHDHYIHGKPRK